MSVSYDSEVKLQCKATGFPRPTVMLLINALRAYTIEGGHSVMAPYEANVTFVVKVTSDVECHVSNRLGSSFVRLRIDVKGLFYGFIVCYLMAMVKWGDVPYT